MADQLSDPAAIEKALNTRGTLARWLHFVGGAEFTQLTPLLRGMQLVDLMRLPPSGLARLGMVPSTARRLERRQNAVLMLIREQEEATADGFRDPSEDLELAGLVAPSGASGDLTSRRTEFSACATVTVDSRGGELGRLEDERSSLIGGDERSSCRASCRGQRSSVAAEGSKSRGAIIIALRIAFAKIIHHAAFGPEHDARCGASVETRRQHGEAAEIGLVELRVGQRGLSDIGLGDGDEQLAAHNLIKLKLPLIELHEIRESMQIKTNECKSLMFTSI